MSCKMRVATLLLIAWAPAAVQAEDKMGDKVALQRVPEGGIQPQVAVDDKGIVHLIYFRGRPAAGDVYYVSSKDSGVTFSAPLRVNSHPGSAIAIGSIRGAQLAVGRNGRVHVAWMGSDRARPRGPDGATPMLYTCLNDKGSAFEEERNVINAAYGLDGGASVAADSDGNVYVAWHAPDPGAKGEDNRRVWIARSTDDGKTFAAENPAYAEPTGACGCCGMRIFADGTGKLHVLYRSAREQVNRDIYLLTSGDRAKTFQGLNLDPWKINTCPMSSMMFAESQAGVVAAWETKGQVYWARIDPATDACGSPIAAPGASGQRKHPAAASNGRGDTILVWTEGTGWEKGGGLAWQVFDRAGKPTGERGKSPGVPAWSLVAVFARPDGRFTVLY